LHVKFSGHVTVAEIHKLSHRTACNSHLCRHVNQTVQGSNAHFMGKFPARHW